MFRDRPAYLHGPLELLMDGLVTFIHMQWVGCDNRTCRRWVHVECEIGGGNPVDSTAFYLCPSCREVLLFSRSNSFIVNAHTFILQAVGWRFRILARHSVAYSSSSYCCFGFDIQNAQEFGDRKRCGRLPAQEQPVVSSCQVQMDSSSSVSGQSSCFKSVVVLWQDCTHARTVAREHYINNNIRLRKSLQDHEQKPKMPLSLRSTRRPLQVDLSKLEVRAFPLCWMCSFETL